MKKFIISIVALAAVGFGAYKLFGNGGETDLNDEVFVN